MSDLQSDHLNQVGTSDLSPEPSRAPPKIWVWVFLLVGIVFGFEVHVQQLIAGRQTYLILALVGASFGRAIDFFQASRPSRGLIYLLPTTILIIVIIVAIKSKPAFSF